MASHIRVALVHDYLVHVRGGERVFDVICDAYPEGDIYGLVYNAAAMRPMSVLQRRGVRTSFLQRLPRASESRWFRAYLPLYPFAASSLDLRGYDLVISSSSAWAHGARLDPRAVQVCYCHSPFRYAWSHYDELIGRSPAQAMLLGPLMQAVRRWDRRASSHVDRYVANSEVTRGRIARYYGRESTLIPPPVELDRFSLSPETDDYYLVVSALVPYKRVDIAVEAFTRLGLPLLIVGDGPERARLERAAGPTVKLLGSLSDAEIARLYSRCRALIFPSQEDFGIVPLEAMASGRPVLAYGAGGALETVRDGLTGRFFGEQTADALTDAVRKLRPESFEPAAIRRHAEQFGVPAFQERFRATVDEALRAKHPSATTATSATSSIAATPATSGAPGVSR
jgi:glycosyltransferase involved in cell wall biosynthesis